MIHHQINTIIPMLDNQGSILMPFSIPDKDKKPFLITLKFSKSEAAELSARINILTKEMP